MSHYGMFTGEYVDALVAEIAQLKAERKEALDALEACLHLIEQMGYKGDTSKVEAVVAKLSRSQS